MAKGGFDGNVRAQLRLILDRNPEFTFEQAAQELYMQMSPSDMGHVLILGGAPINLEILDDKLKIELEKKGTLSVADVARITILEAFRQYALEDPSLKEKIAA